MTEASQYGGKVLNMQQIAAKSLALEEIEYRYCGNERVNRSNTWRLSIFQAFYIGIFPVSFL